MADSQSAAYSPQEQSYKTLMENLSFPLAHSLAHDPQIDPDLARLIEAWPTLPPTAKRMILAVLEASSQRK
jgi:hypothetical protein